MLSNGEIYNLAFKLQAEFLKRHMQVSVVELRDFLKELNRQNIQKPAMEEKAREWAEGKIKHLTLVPVGGFFTIDAKTVAEVSKHLKSLITIPMHFKVGAMKLPIEGVEPFIKAMGSAKKLDSREIELKPGGLEKYGGAVVFMYEYVL